MYNEVPRLARQRILPSHPPSVPSSSFFRFPESRHPIHRILACSPSRMLLFCSKTTNFTYERGGGGKGGQTESGKHEGRLARQKVPRKITHTSRVPQHWLIAFLRLSPRIVCLAPPPPVPFPILFSPSAKWQLNFSQGGHGKKTFVTRDSVNDFGSSSAKLEILFDFDVAQLQFTMFVVWTMFACDVNDVCIIINKFNATMIFSSFSSTFFFFFLRRLT